MIDTILIVAENVAVVEIKCKLSAMLCLHGHCRIAALIMQGSRTLVDEVHGVLVKHIQQFPEDCEKEKGKLLLVNKRFVRVIAERYVSAEHPIEKLIEQGNKGLLFAVNKFDETKGFKFISVAIYYIKDNIKQFIANK